MRQTAFISAEEREVNKDEAPSSPATRSMKKDHSSKSLEILGMEITSLTGNNKSYMKTPLLEAVRPTQSLPQTPQMGATDMDEEREDIREEAKSVLHKSSYEMNTEAQNSTLKVTKSDVPGYPDQLYASEIYHPQEVDEG